MYLDYILKWDYEILPQLQSESISETELERLRQKYSNLLA